MSKWQMVKDIIRNIYERDWYTPYSQRPRKWKWGWHKAAENTPVTNEEAIMWIEEAEDYMGLLPIEMAIAALRAENEKSILYICDRKKCNEGECPNPECFHTTDPNHRRREGGSPSIFVEDQDGNLWEKYQMEIKEGERNE